ncbi:MAG: hypothetical protein KatS3mg111_0292 [Pirellulaceae bacterium]|nr:MAG: hypothetical protein KatS3mg111_0292 [Pirellulaceae bacterium]
MKRALARTRLRIGSGMAMACVLFIGGTFAVSGLGHITNPVRLFEHILRYDLLPYWVAVFAATVLPWLELGLAVLLLLGLSRPVAFACSALLSTGFVVAQSWALWRGLEIDCGCFGALLQRSVGAESLSLAVAVLVASVIGMSLTTGSEPSLKSNLTGKAACETPGRRLVVQ